MRQPEYLSYSAFNLWESRPDEFYLRYLSEHRPPRVPQEHPAAVGSCFDALIKSELHTAIGGTDPALSFDSLFEAQVEPQNRDWALSEGQYVFNCYKLSGFYKEILIALLDAEESPRFEFTVQADISGVPFLGKPDARWASAGGIHIVHDWKVNGYCSKNPTSPHKSYMMCRDGYTNAKPSKSHGTEHREFLAYQHGDVVVNSSYLEHAHPAWADQLTLYGWCLGEPIGDENIVLSVHQIVAKPAEPRPLLRMAAYRARVSHDHQMKLADRLRCCWVAIQSGHIFQSMSREDSDARCATLEDTAVGLASDGSSREEYFSTATRDLYMG